MGRRWLAMSGLVLLVHQGCENDEKEADATDDGVSGGASSIAGGSSAGRGNAGTTSTAGQGSGGEGGDPMTAGEGGAGGDLIAAGGGGNAGEGGDLATGAAGSGGSGGEGGENCEQDLDGDGFGACDDCCDSEADGCENPEQVQPGGVDFPGNDQDDDCSGVADDEPTCDTEIGDDPSPADFARALELCRNTSEESEAWGLVSAAFTLSAGTGIPNTAQYEVRDDFGAITPRAGSKLVGLSTGRTGAPGDPNYTAFQDGVNHNTASTFPADWLSANGNELPVPSGCPSITPTQTRDSVLLRLRVRVPPNARAFSVDAFYLSADYPEYVCSPYTDFFVALLDSEYDATPSNPADKNFALFRTAGDDVMPISANFVAGDSGLFVSCVDGGTGCAAGAVDDSNSTCTSVTDLVDTGFDVSHDVCENGDGIVGGGTGWLRFAGNVLPGEVAELRFVLWDTGDGLYDSLVLLDRFEWLPEPITPGSL